MLFNWNICRKHLYIYIIYFLGGYSISMYFQFLGLNSGAADHTLSVSVRSFRGVCRQNIMYGRAEP